MDVRCIIQPGHTAIVIDCADTKTWTEWRQKQEAQKEGT